MNYPLPRNSSIAWLAHKKKVPQNPSLIFDRFVQDWGRDQGKDSEAKKKAWEELLETAGKADIDLLRQWILRWQAMVQAAQAKTFPMKTSWRLIAGLGNKGALEVGFTFHRYGFPILPGSSVKGIARAWGLYLIAETLSVTDDLEGLDKALNIDEERVFKNEFNAKFSQPSDEAIRLVNMFRAIFGTPGCTGQAVFFDGIPVQLPKLELDVMNPHYADYYQDQTGKTPPASWLSPVPIYFLTVVKDSEFNFAIGWRDRHAGDDADNLHCHAIKWLKDGLKYFGAGAKTSAGYGYFIDQDETAGHKPLSAAGQDLSSAVHLEAAVTIVPALAIDPDQAKADQIISEIQSIKTSAVAGSINQYYQRWRDMKINQEQKRRIAEAIVAKVKEAGREKQSLEKEWYKELLAF